MFLCSPRSLFSLFYNQVYERWVWKTLIYIFLLLRSKKFPPVCFLYLHFPLFSLFIVFTFPNQVYECQYDKKKRTYSYFCFAVMFKKLFMHFFLSSFSFAFLVRCIHSLKSNLWMSIGCEKCPYFYFCFRCYVKKVLPVSLCVICIFIFLCFHLSFCFVSLFKKFLPTLLMRFSLLFFSAFLLHCILFFLINVMNVERAWKASIIFKSLSLLRSKISLLCFLFIFPPSFSFAFVLHSILLFLPKVTNVKQGVKRFHKSLFCCSVQKMFPRVILMLMLIKVFLRFSPLH